MAERYELSIDPEKLYRGCVYLESLFEAYMAERDAFADSMSWEDGVFVFSDLDGVDGCLVFRDRGKSFAGVLRNIGYYEENARKCRIKTETIFSRAIDADVRDSLGPEALSHMAVEYFHIAAAESGRGPLVTTAFWKDPDGVFSCDDPEEFARLGGAFVTDVLLAGEEKIRGLFEEEFAPEAADFDERARAIYEAKIGC
ncbi:MAG: hypothetical protein IKE37_06245 [Firmicutes bacterium]|nr:hypothetical protein [Bacillota bacterium]